MKASSLDGTSHESSIQLWNYMYAQVKTILCQITLSQWFEATRNCLKQSKYTTMQLRKTAALQRLTRSMKKDTKTADIKERTERTNDIVCVQFNFITNKLTKLHFPFDEHESFFFYVLHCWSSFQWNSFNSISP